MKEDFLHYVWKFRKFEQSGLLTSNKESIAIHHPGQYLRLAGPDFFNAHITIDNQKWAGNVEIHVRSSDWYVHEHEKDTAYDNVILHVVWEHDVEIFRKGTSLIPVLELKPYVRADTIGKYESLMFPKSWIYCEKQLTDLDAFVIDGWLERLFVERLERKSKAISDLLQQLANDWEAVLFCLLAKNFGLNTNGEAFLKIAQSIPFEVIRKEGSGVANLEALLFGQAGLLNSEKEDCYFHSLKSRFAYLSHKRRLEQPYIGTVQFFKHRPDNFPTIRLSQLCSLYAGQQNLFSKIIGADTVQMIYEIFNLSVSDYWQTHYLFDRESQRKAKSLSKSFINLIVINTIVPIRFAFSKSIGKETAEEGIAMLRQLPSEDNSVIQKFDSFGLVSDNAFRSQALLQLKSDYCSKGRCLDCAIGISLLKSG